MNKPAFSEFIPGEILHNERGRRVEYVGKCEGNLLVKLGNVIYENGEEYESFDEIAVEPRLFRSAPRASIDKDIEKLRAEEKALKESLTALRAEHSQQERIGKEIFNRVTQHAQLGRLDDFIAGRFSHVVLEDWSGVSVMTKEDALKYEEQSSYRTKGETKLMTLFGKSNGDLQWRINHYSDGSGNHHDAWPCCSLEEARTKAQEIIDAATELWVADKARAKSTDWFVRSCKAAAMEVPPAIADYLEQSRLRHARERLAKIEQERAELLQTLPATEAAA